MIVDGETYACEGCIRGHRTRNCQHKDRPLQLIKQKGRPVSQCQHCRSQRKSRSAHVKCQCGKHADGVGGCGCHSGGRCTCATKKSPKQETPKMDAVPEFAPSDMLGSPAFTDLAFSNPSQITSPSDFGWRDMTSPSSGYTMDATGPVANGLSPFDGTDWLVSEHLQQPPETANSQMYSGNFAANGNDSEAAHDFGINALPSYQQLDAPLDMPNMNEWPNVDSDATKEFLGLLDSSNADLGLDTSGWDTSAMFPMANSNDPPESLFNTTEYSSTVHTASNGQMTKTSDENGDGGRAGGGGCCS